MLLALALGCGGSDSSNGPDAEPLVLVTVTFSYFASTTLNPDVPNDHPGCFGAVSPTHIHASWDRGFSLRRLSPVADNEWSTVYDDVPTHRRNAIRVNDPNNCVFDPLGAVTSDVYANGVLLTDIVDTPGMGPEPGFAFDVDADGVVTP